MDHEQFKCIIDPRRNYQSTSEADIIEPRRMAMYSAGARADSHIFVKLDDMEDIKGQGNFAKLKWKPVAPEETLQDQQQKSEDSEEVEEFERERQH